MKITLSFASFLGIDRSLNGKTIEVPDGATAAEVIKDLSINKKYVDHVIPMINDTIKKTDEPLKDGDKLHLFLPVAGG